MQHLDNGFSWIPADVSWAFADDHLFAGVVEASSDGLVELLAEDAAIVPAAPADTLRLFSQTGSIIGDALSLACEAYLLHNPASAETDTPVRVKLHDLTCLPEGRILIVFDADPNAPDRPSDSERQGRAADCVRHFEEAQRQDDERARQEEARLAPLSRTAEDRKAFQKMSSLRPLYLPGPRPPRFTDLNLPVSTAAFVCPLPKGLQAATRAVVRAAAATGKDPPRDGKYECVVVAAAGGDRAGIVKWQPRGNVTPSLEIKYAIEKRRKSVLESPRRNDTAEPSFTGELRQVDIDEPLEDLDDIALSDLLPNADGRDLFKRDGFEAIAWYQPFHRYTNSAWGIYLAASRLDQVAAGLAEDLRQTQSRPHSLAARLAVHLTLAHELFHARVEFAAAWLELTARGLRYAPYVKGVYESTRQTSDWLEEALANWSAHRWLLENGTSMGPLDGDREAVVRVVEDWLDFSPAGYRDWRVGHSLRSWQRLSNEIVTGTPYRSGKSCQASPVEGLLTGNSFFDLRLVDVPVHVVGRGAVTDALFNAPSRREATHVLQRFGYQPLSGRGKGSHEVWAGPDGRKFVVPCRDPLSTGVFQKLLHHFGLSKKQYMNEVRL